MKKFECKKCKEFFYSGEDHFDYADNLCENCGECNSYAVVKDEKLTVVDMGCILDDELENANWHSPCGIGERIGDVIENSSIGQYQKPELMRKICNKICESI